MGISFAHSLDLIEISPFATRLPVFSGVRPSIRHDLRFLPLSRIIFSVCVSVPPTTHNTNKQHGTNKPQHKSTVFSVSAITKVYGIICVHA